MKGSELHQVITARDYLNDLIAEALGSYHVSPNQKAEFFGDYIRENSPEASDEQIAEIVGMCTVGAIGNALDKREDAAPGELERYFGADGPAGKAARAAEEVAGALPDVEARLEGITIGQLTLYGIRGAYLYHRALAEQEKGGEGWKD